MMDLFKRKSTLSDNGDKKRNKLQNELEKKRVELEKYAKVSIKQNEKFNILREEYNKMASKFKVEGGKLKMVDNDDTNDIEQNQPIEQNQRQPIEQNQRQYNKEFVNKTPQEINQNRVPNMERFERNRPNNQPSPNRAHRPIPQMTEAEYRAAQEEILNEQYDNRRAALEEENENIGIVTAGFHFVDGSKLELNIASDDIDSFKETIVDFYTKNMPLITNESMIILSNVKFIIFE